jgi:hypothetical protein
VLVISSVCVLLATVARPSSDRRGQAAPEGVSAS